MCNVIKKLSASSLAKQKMTKIAIFYSSLNTAQILNNIVFKILLYHVLYQFKRYK